SARPEAKVITIEADSSLADLAQKNFKRLGLNNIRLIRGRFDDNLPLLLKEISKFDLVFIDGNHRKEPVLNYFRLISVNMVSSGIMVLDDIHWSAEMEEAWDILKKEERVSLSIDLFFTGILFFKNGFQKENFVLNF
ncbi:MAG: class I SAM-dependent methyltransferase, partial [Bacteroidota bacterium]|nr:class I SAM-dependent methyltransferase [Bacteroidota bacterium]